jgi:hypothetical protein
MKPQLSAILQQLLLLMQKDSLGNKRAASPQPWDQSLRWSAVCFERRAFIARERLFSRRGLSHPMSANVAERLTRSGRTSTQAASRPARASRGEGLPPRGTFLWRMMTTPTLCGMSALLQPQLEVDPCLN